MPIPVALHRALVCHVVKKQRDTAKGKAAPTDVMRFAK